MKKIGVIIGILILIIVQTALSLKIEPKLSYNETLLNSSNNEYKLNLITTSENYTIDIINSSYVTYAKKSIIDVTERLQAVDGNVATVIKGSGSSSIDVVFDHNLTNNDKIIMYLDGFLDTEVFLCPYETDCESPGYGTVNYMGRQEGFYEIIISNLPNPTNKVRIDPEMIKFDYVYANYTIQEEYTNITTSYPESGILNSSFIEPENISKFDLLEKTEELNNQSILYEYTTDDINYKTIVDFNLSYIDSARIKLRITLQSYAIFTPVLKNLILNYNLICIENWNCTDWSSCIDSLQNRTCIDQNSCGTELDKPEESQSCTEDTGGTSESSVGSSGGGNSAPSSVYQTEKAEESIPKLSEAKTEEITESNLNSKQPAEEKQQEIITSNIIKEQNFVISNLNYIISSIIIVILAGYIYIREIKDL